MPRALILGIGGMDGSHLTDVLLEKGYEVHGLHRRSSVDNLQRLGWRVRQQIGLHQGDLSDPQSVEDIIADVRPNEIYNEADQDNVDHSYKTPALSMDITAGAVMRTLESVRKVNKAIKFFQPLSATVFGDAPPMQDEDTPFNPHSPYAVGKVAAYYVCRYFRQVHGMYVNTGILFNHDSPRRSEQYLLHRICTFAVKAAIGEAQRMAFSDRAALDVRVDIGYAEDYMRGAQQMMQLPTSGDYVLATGEAWTIREMMVEAFKQAGVSGTPESRITENALLKRPGTTPTYIGRTLRAHQFFGFNPPTKMPALIGMLIAAAKERLRL